MINIKQSTSRAIKIYACDVSGAPVTGKVDANWTKSIGKAGGQGTAMTVTITEDVNLKGWYRLTLSTFHTDTLGEMSCSFEATGVVQVNVQYNVATYVTDDLALASTQTTLASAIAAVQADTDDLQTRIPAALVGGRMDASVGAMAANVITAAATAADAGTELAAAVWAFAHESGRTAKGVLVRLDALMAGKATGLIGTVAAYFRADGTTKAIEATQDTALGTRTAASTLAGD